MTIHNFLKVAFLSGEKRFSAQTKASYQITTVKKFHFSCGLEQGWANFLAGGPH